jgi:acyl carrier protein
VKPDVVGGHSFGEVTALHAAGVLDLEAFLRVARRRGELMAEAAEQPGAMLAVAHGRSEIEEAVEAWGGAVAVANHNSPRQVVLSGPTTAIEETAARLRERGITARRLNVATAFHSPLVSGSIGAFRDFLGTVPFAESNVPVFAGATAAPYPREPEAMRAVLAEQIARPVRFVEQIEAMYAAGVRTFVELGAGAALTGLVGEILEGREHAAVSLDRKGMHGLTALWNGLGRLAVRGVSLSLSELWTAEAPVADPQAAAKRPALTLKVHGGNYGRPYPPAGGAAALPPPNPERPTAASAPLVPEVAAATVPAVQRPAVAAPVPPGVSSPDVIAWAQAYQEVQRHTAEAHAAYQRAMADSHAAFLRMAETSVATLGALLTGAGPVAHVATLAPQVPTEPAVRREAATTASAAWVVAPLRPPTENAAPPVAMVPPAAVVSPDAPLSPRPAVGSGTKPVARDLAERLLAVVADKTGYPAETLKLEMELEADLGIDSIKRVEILSALQESVSGLPEVSVSEMAGLRTLGQIVAHLQTSAAPGGTAGVSRSAPPVARTPPATTVDLSSLLLSVVAEKTGYPAETLKLEMELEADLGIDSIKRVEILAALQERVPALPDVPVSEMAGLRTLGQIVAHLRPETAPAAAPAEWPEAPPSVAEPRRAPEPTPAVLGATRLPAAPSVGRFALSEANAPAAGLAMPGLFAGQPVIVTADGNGVAEAVAARLRGMGLDVRTADRVPEGAASVLFLGGLAAVGSVEQALEVNRQAFRAARTVATRLASAGGAFVTVQDTGGDFGLSGADPTRAWLGGLAGLAKTAAQEWPLASVKAIDLERGGRSADALADAIVGELCAGGLEHEVGLHADGRRTTLTSQRDEIPPGPLPIDERSVIVATGGARGVTAAALLALARRAKPRLALIGRTPLEPEPAECVGVEGEADLHRVLLATAHGKGRTPSPAELRAGVRRILGGREVRESLAALRDAGSPVMYLVADVQDSRSLDAALDEIRTAWGPLTGLVHAAGVLADKRIAEKTDDQFAAVFDTKVRGLQVLLEASANDPLRLLCFFSSVAGRSGNEGQCDYAMANEVLNKVAGAEARRRRGTCLVKSINWGPWDGGMVSAALKARFLERGVAVIPREEGSLRFVAELAGPPAQVEVVIGGAPTGRALLAAPARHEAEIEVVVSAVSHPYLTDHRVQGTPVVPVVLALEWFAQVAAACRPDLVLAECRDVKVLRGIRLTRFDAAGERLQVTGREISNGSSARLALELRGEDGGLHYTAVAEMLPPASRPPWRDVIAAPARMPGPWSASEAYRDLLFHGPAFQLIRSLEGVAPDGSAALLAGTREAGWIGGPWRTDAAALDGGLQLAIVWSHRILGRPSLPTRVGAFVSHRSGLAEGPVRCTLQAKDVGPHRTVCDLVFTTGAGIVIAELRDVEMHALPAQGAGPHQATDGAA